MLAVGLLLWFYYVVMIAGHSVTINIRKPKKNQNVILLKRTGNYTAHLRPHGKVRWRKQENQDLGFLLLIGSQGLGAHSLLVNLKQ